MLGAVFADPDAHLAAWSGRHAWNRTRNSGMTARRRAKPVAAAAYFVHERGLDLAEGATALEHDLDGGTLDATLIRRTGDGFDEVGCGGLLDAGGLNIDAAIVAMLAATGPTGRGS